ncbi:NAD(P)-dependent dehydrogenase, short-chain alcohol dehydrogenase family [Parafrankia irregularis]|uniref:NAD(P)-dependent dehydrogenase, short-chain alcohol dehydrogenase family n=1 Tax=Parafrankia irregularis TaxID=795642 RepID=A0A0S4QT84_9ACTN|nr:MULTISPECIES: SDR family oxidoreductase [Parafrankia]MBE3206147.1 SDR family oxidoreductase [Parafrankia sp. CH37]CUU57638.1 NAD(P)-dependent dehydrogenase, short-chain alcohol dehydrogenase family [Parafrankia irregularis]
MTETAAFRYDGKRVLVVGGATGMGAAAARAVSALGAEVVVMDRAPVDYPVDQQITVDLTDPGALDAAIDQVTGPLHAVFSAAGIAGGPAVMRVNFIAHRHLAERLVQDGTLVPGSAICMISSVAGLGWQNHLPLLVDFLATPDYASADAWVDGHDGTCTYMFSKQAINAYVARESYPLLTKGIRINAVCPGPTDTPLARANTWLGFDEQYRKATATAPLRADEIADVMAFLNSSAAAGVSGVSLLVDSGHVMSSIGGSWETGRPVIEFLMTQRSV